MNIKDYIVITPIRNEEDYIEHTILSMIEQTIKPLEWIIVNDGSTDNTQEIVEKYLDQHKWIRLLNRQDRGFRKAGGGVIEAFYHGYNSIRFQKWQFIVKLDGDLSFQPDYFEKSFSKFDEDPKLGIGGGDIYNVIDDKLVYEKTPRFHVRGATKVYKDKCWSDIKGLIQAPGWDTLDEVKANMEGWKTESFCDLKVTHHRYTGDADGTWKNWVKNGQGSYIVGYHPLFLILKCIKRCFQKPYIIPSLGLMYGFFGGYFKKISQIEDKKLIQYLRTEQVKRVFFKKSIWH